MNTSICEQFNSYLQCIAQYMVHIWNKSKQIFREETTFCYGHHLSNICYYEDLFDKNDCIYFPRRKFRSASDYYNPWITKALNYVSAWIYHAVLNFALLPPFESNIISSLYVKMYTAPHAIFFICAEINWKKNWRLRYRFQMDQLSSHSLLS